MFNKIITIKHKHISNTNKAAHTNIWCWQLYIYKKQNKKDKKNQKQRNYTCQTWESNTTTQQTTHEIKHKTNL